MIHRISIALAFAALLATAQAPGQAPNPDWLKWYPQFQAAVARRDAKAIADMAKFPMSWRLGKIERAGSKAAFIEKFDTYFPEDARRAVANEKPESYRDGSYTVSWERDEIEYGLVFHPDGKGGYRLGSLARNDF